MIEIHEFEYKDRFFGVKVKEKIFEKNFNKKYTLIVAQTSQELWQDEI